MITKNIFRCLFFIEIQWAGCTKVGVGYKSPFRAVLPSLGSDILLFIVDCYEAIKFI